MILLALVLFVGIFLYYYYIPATPGDRFPISSDNTAVNQTDTKNQTQSKAQTLVYPRPSVIPQGAAVGDTLFPAYYLTITGTKTTTYADSKGHTANAFIREDELRKLEEQYKDKENVDALDLLKLQSSFGNQPKVTQYITGDDSVELIVSPDDTYTVTIGPEAAAVHIELYYGFEEAESAEFALRYVDLLLPPNQKAQLVLSKEGVRPLFGDTNGDGNFTTLIPPTAVLYGKSARDAQGPQITFTKVPHPDGDYLQVTAVDDAGIKNIQYSLDDTNYSSYTARLKLSEESPIITVVAEDTVGNKSLKYYTYTMQ
jgi:hypothetical protein